MKLPLEFVEMIKYDVVLYHLFSRVKVQRKTMPSTTNANTQCK